MVTVDHQHPSPDMWLPSRLSSLPQVGHNTQKTIVIRENCWRLALRGSWTLPRAQRNSQPAQSALRNVQGHDCGEFLPLGEGEGGALGACQPAGIHRRSVLKNSFALSAASSAKNARKLQAPRCARQLNAGRCRGGAAEAHCTAPCCPPAQAGAALFSKTPHGEFLPLGGRIAR